MAVSSHWQRVQELFKKAANRPADERAALLAEDCGDDAELRAEVESLLEHDSQLSDDFLRPPEPPASVRVPDTPDGPDPLIGTRIGHYHVEGLIAVGGMGTVYEARQDQPRRTVALKVMKQHVASQSALRRFRFESEVLGRLRHPNVAQVFEAGMHDTGHGRVPYFALEYVPGAKTITQYAEGRVLDTPERLRLFTKVCDAVHHGHQKGIIHRDLKPANILVDSAGEPKVIDFGVARATDADVAVTTQHTLTGQIIGTMQYMSPEQCDADPHELDTRSDVYSLGVVLYELLTGELPYRATGTTIFQAAEAIKEQMPRRPSSIRRGLRGDVETIVLKALEKDREKRYQSAADLGQDLARFLNHEPIEAHPPTGWTRAMRWVARHPALTATAGGVAIAATIIVATFVFVWLVNARPYRIELLNDGREARLLAHSGRILWQWFAETPRGIRFGELVRRPAELGGGQLALIFFGAHHGRFPGSLCAFDAEGDLEEPLWRRRIETEDILRQLREERGFVGDEFGVGGGWVRDVFPERPGPEVVAVFSAGIHSQRVLRIYDLAGELLYEVWHDGPMEERHWMSDARLLVFAGTNAAVNWDRGQVKGTRPDPSVIFALRPAVGFTNSDGYLPCTPGDDPLSPVWYLFLGHGDEQSAFERVRLRRPDPPHDAGRHVKWTVEVSDQIVGAAVWWVIDEHGQEVAGTRDCGDGYKRNQLLADDAPDKLPDPDGFYLSPAPPS